MNLRLASAAVLLCTALLFSTRASAGCGAEGERACVVEERVPSCDLNLTEGQGRCWRPACGQEGQRGCGPTERVTFNFLLGLPMPQVCDADLVHDPIANRCRRPNCGREGGPPCTVFQRVPSCDVNLGESVGKCVRPPCGGLGQALCSPETLGGLLRTATIYTVGLCDANLVPEYTSKTCTRPGLTTPAIATAVPRPQSPPVSQAPAVPAPTGAPPPPGIRLPTPPAVSAAPNVLPPPPPVVTYGGQTAQTSVPPPPLPAVASGGTAMPPGTAPPPPASGAAPAISSAADGGYTAGYQAGFQAGFSAGQAAAVPPATSPPPGDNAALSPEPGSAIVRAARPIFGSGENIEASFAGMPGSKGDWMAIAAAGAPDNSYIEWTYLGGKQSGVHRFSQRYKPGRYEIRLYKDWPAGNYQAVARTTFIVQ